MFTLPSLTPAGGSAPRGGAPLLHLLQEDVLSSSDVTVNLICAQTPATHRSSHTLELTHTVFSDGAAAGRVGLTGRHMNAPSGGLQDEQRSPSSAENKHHHRRYPHRASRGKYTFL
ncbi:hypothetical protein CesoFtcFv8_024482 [Champsocephalus esox]|uniref:Uncharacterized protein n=2 Tax=Champsocephalus TaxID=52236 RepID=A0AAN8H3J6_CHAGU|nr:hypothetical protein CesoFtcFv8_024482 [Champsocephalus esox]KAK5901103.1 hypothetical protein CgunFtcFv8_026005 [Champsocephalus gunnari]